MPDVKIAAAQQAQSTSDKDKLKSLLRSKRRRTKTLSLVINGETAELKFQALSQVELDKLRAKFPPTTKQRADGAGVDTDKFAPALVAACLLEPEMSEDETRDLWESGEWSTGELAQLFEAASSLCLEGMDIPFNASV